MKSYEHKYPWLVEAAALVELALWKSMVNESLTLNERSVGNRNHDQMMENVANRKRECRMNCGAGVIIRNVLL